MPWAWAAFSCTYTHSLSMADLTTLYLDHVIFKSALRKFCAWVLYTRRMWRFSTNALEMAAQELHTFTVRDVCKNCPGQPNDDLMVIQCMASSVSSQALLSSRAGCYQMIWPHSPWRTCARAARDSQMVTWWSSSALPVTGRVTSPHRAFSMCSVSACVLLQCAHGRQQARRQDGAKAATWNL